MDKEAQRWQHGAVLDGQRVPAHSESQQQVPVAAADAAGSEWG